MVKMRRMTQAGEVVIVNVASVALLWWSDGTIESYLPASSAVVSLRRPCAMARDLAFWGFVLRGG